MKLFLFFLVFVVELGSVLNAASLSIDWEGVSDRKWPGPELWTNRLQDWEVKEERLFCYSDPYFGIKNAPITTLDADANKGRFQIATTVRVEHPKGNQGSVGFLVGAGAGALDYRGAALVHGKPGKGGGLLALLDLDHGKVRFLDFSVDGNIPELISESARMATLKRGQAITLQLSVEPEGARSVALTLSLIGQAGAVLGEHRVAGVDALYVRGMVSMAAVGKVNGSVYSFDKFSADGEGLSYFSEQSFGPIAGALFSVDENVFKLGVQFVDLGEAKIPLKPGEKRVSPKVLPRLTARVEIEKSGRWLPLFEPKTIIQPDYYVLYRSVDWNYKNDQKLRVVFEDIDGRVYHYEVTVPYKSPDATHLNAGTFSCMGANGMVASLKVPKVKPGYKVIGRWTKANLWAPFEALVDSMEDQEPDILFFTGDQIYEGKPTAPAFTSMPVDDYFYKFFIWHWAFRDLTRKTPSILQTDDHDVYQGNIFGQGGRINTTGKNWSGGYECSPYFVNLVQRTMCGHNPDPIDPYNFETGISNYYTSFEHGGVSFFVLEDRKFKSFPAQEDPALHTLLGEKQEAALIRWAQSDSGKVKCAVSQTIYTNLSTQVNGKPLTERDSNCWPPEPRRRVVDVLAENGVVVISGDQHLATLARVYASNGEHSFYQFAAPPAGNIYWRWFYPAGKLPISNGFLDGQGNRFDMLAVANPLPAERLLSEKREHFLIPENEFSLNERYTRGDGYGFIRFDHQSEKVTVEAWPNGAYPEREGKPFEGWPYSVGYDDL